MSTIVVSDRKTGKIIESFDGNFQASDGYHTFDELYHYRALYNAMLFTQWQYKDDRHGNTIRVVKSRKHSDGKLCFDAGGEWFVVVADLPTGQVTNHYHADYWDMFDIAEAETAPKWDGHTAKEAAERMERYARGEY